MSTKRISTLAHTTLGVLLAGTTATSAQETANPPVVVQAEAGEIPSAYGAPPDLSHGRISTLTKSYVLSPFSLEVENGAACAHNSRSAKPSRTFAGDTFDHSFTLEARYALANWNKLPLLVG